MKNYSSLKLAFPPCALFVYGPPRLFFEAAGRHSVPERSFLYYLSLLRMIQRSNMDGTGEQWRANPDGTVAATVWDDEAGFDTFPRLVLSIGGTLWWSNSPEGMTVWDALYDNRTVSAGTKEEVLRVMTKGIINTEALCAEVELFADMLDAFGLLEKGIIT